MNKNPRDIISSHKCTVNDNFVILGHFLPFYPPPPRPTPLTTQIMEVSKKWKKLMEKSSFCKIVPKNMIISYTVPETWHLTDAIFLIILSYFLPLYPCNSPQNENFRKMKKTPGAIIILHKCIPKIMIICHSISEIWRVTDVNVVFRMYCCFSFLAIFYRLTRLTAWKMKISQKWKKQPEISSFYTSVRKIMIRGYTVPEVWHVTDVVFIFHFGLFFALLPP